MQSARLLQAARLPAFHRNVRSLSALNGFSLDKQRSNAGSSCVPRHSLAEPLVLAPRWSRAGPAVPRRLLGTNKGRSSGIFGDILKESEEEEKKAAAEAATKASASEDAAAAAAGAASSSEPASEPILAPEPPAGDGSSSSGGSSAGSNDAAASTAPPDGGVDQDLWDLLLQLKVENPHAVSDALADNSIFALEDVVDMPHYRLKSFGVEPHARYLIGSWVVEHHGEESDEGDGTMKPFEPDEEERAFAPGGAAGSASGADGDAAPSGSENSSDGSAAGNSEDSDASAKKKEEEEGPPKPEQPPFDWAAFQAALPGYAAAAWADVKLSAKELFTLDKDESVLTQRVHAKRKKRSEKEGAEGSSDGGDGEYEEPEGGTALLVVKEGESAWTRIRSRLAEAPLFQELYRRAREAQKTEAAKSAQKARDKLSDKVEDAREVWETSQNPWVYRASELWDWATHETDTAVVLKELRKLDPNFSLEVWKDNMREVYVPKLLEAWLRSDSAVLKELCKEDVLTKLMHDIAARKKEKVSPDPNVLSVDHAEVIVDPAMTERQMLIGLFVAAQQIHCVRNHDGEIIEGAEDAFKLYRYFLVFQREYVEEEGELVWRLVDFSSAGDEDQMF